ncbi:hypothetical protein MPDQ_003266 [Monascus purpureus]|uniref:Uncharacterized protein n=1 Tax=Monascus purpureus TaxID=5098 RepID=A0A507QZ18_MONPU|nr:hypothetical protein MPDQ_003266 [Monascus purpureus]
MRLSLLRPQTGHRPSLLLLLLFLVIFIVSHTSAQATSVDAATTAADNAATQPTDGPTAATTDTDMPKLTTASGPSETSEASGSSGSSRSTDTGMPSLTTDTAMPTLTSDTEMPTLSSTDSSAATSSFQVPVVTVPPMEGAPYLRKSNTPEGTLFIAVGSALGAIALAVLAWRALVAWSVNRSVRRAAMLNALESKRFLRKKKKRRTATAAAAASASYPMTSPSTLGVAGSDLSSYIGPKAPGSNSGLFFSPTAGPGYHQPGTRTSTYLPAGYYAAGPAIPGAHGSSLRNPSPPGSPAPPSSAGLDSQYNTHRRSSFVASMSSLNLTSAPQGRAPSAYLDDLFDNHGQQHR